MNTKEREGKGGLLLIFDSLVTYGDERESCYSYLPLSIMNMYMLYNLG